MATVRQREMIPTITTQDAIRAWKETEVHYGVIISLQSTTVAHNGTRGCIGFLWEVKRLTGTKGYKRIHYRAMDYPSRQYATFPAFWVYSLSAIAIWLEEERTREKEALKQTPIFPEG